MKTLCSESSTESGEEMFGTAPRADAWLLIEYRGHWSGSAYKDSKIPKKVKSFLNKAQKAFSNSRLQVIKKHKNPNQHLKLFIAVSRGSKPRLYEITFTDYEELLSLNIEKILKSKEYLSDKKIYIICTNGEYDRCCGKLGMPLYLEIAKGAYGPNTWEVNHIGGHRFAPTFVCLPEGVVYGRVGDAETAEQLMKQHEAGVLNTKSFRGRSCHSSEAQAAEYYLREKTGVLEISEFSFKNAKKGGKKHNIKFVSQSEKKTHGVKLELVKKSVGIIKSCGDKSSSVPKYKLLECKS